MYQLLLHSPAVVFIVGCALHALFTEIFGALLLGARRALGRLFGARPQPAAPRRGLDSRSDLCHGRSHRCGRDVEDVRRSVKHEGPTDLVNP